jgi:type III restriction enzyme
VRVANFPIPKGQLHLTGNANSLDEIKFVDALQRSNPKQFMTINFFDQPILNSPYEYPRRHWELDERGQPTGQVVEGRRKASFITPIPKPKKQSEGQIAIALDEGKGLSSESQHYDIRSLINELRIQVDRWRSLPDASTWHVTPETARLLQHWRNHKFSGIRPFYCQVEAVETLIWLTEVAPSIGKDGKRFLDHIASVNREANPELLRIALKLATGAGKTTVMAMLIAWQTINAVRHPGSKRFTRGFLVVTPGITIKDRLRVLQPNDPDSYYRGRELVPTDLAGEIGKAKIVITNYHSFRLRERMELSAGGRALLQGYGPALDTKETEGQMLQRVMPELMGMKGVWAINDEAHHCYRERAYGEEETALKGDEKQEAETNREAARLWISGLEAVNRKLGLTAVLDLSATPFFLRGSGYVEGTLFPWTMSDFSLMDAIECGVVKLPRVPVADNIPEAEIPIFRELWKHIAAKMPKKGRGKGGQLDPLSIPLELQTALEALYGHYAKTFEVWQKTLGIDAVPCFIVVCNNTASSKLVYDYISGFHRENADGSTILENGRLPLFRNFDEHGNPYGKPRTLLIDSEQLESGEKLDDNFRKMAVAEIEQFRREIVERTGDRERAENLTDQDLLREVMNTVGKKGRLGESIRCVVSVSMLTEGWDANTVTHVLGVRAFGTQLLCEQVIGRALRRQSYETNEQGLFDVEYADVLGIPFDFTAKPVVVGPQTPKSNVTVKAISPERDHLEIRFPRVEGYRVELPEERLEATFTDDHTLRLTPELVGPTQTRNSGIIGEGVDLTLIHSKDLRQSTLLFHLTKRLLETKWRDPNGEPKLHLFGQLKRITREWLGTHLICVGGTYPAQLMYQELADEACNRIHAGIVSAMATEKTIFPLLDPYNPIGSTRHVNFTTSKTLRWETDARRCHINWVICDSNWETEFCRVLEKHPRVVAYVKNHSLGFEVPYRMGSSARQYRPDFIVLVDDGNGADDPLHLVVEIKGRRGEDAQNKADTMRTYWIPAVNNLGDYGRWAVAEFSDVYSMDGDFEDTIDARVADLIHAAAEQLAGKGS